MLAYRVLTYPTVYCVMQQMYDVVIIFVICESSDRGLNSFRTVLEYRSGGQNRGYHKDYDQQNSGRYDRRYYDDGQSRSHRNGYDHQNQNRGQRSGRQYYNDDGRSYGNRGEGNQHFYEDDYYYDSRDGYQGGSSRQDGGDYYDDRQHGNRGYQSRYSYRADEHHAPAKTYNTKASALSADQPQTTDDFL